MPVFKTEVGGARGGKVEKGYSAELEAAGLDEVSFAVEVERRKWVEFQLEASGGVWVTLAF